MIAHNTCAILRSYLKFSDDFYKLSNSPLKCISAKASKSRASMGHLRLIFLLRGGGGNFLYGRFLMGGCPPFK